PPYDLVYSFSLIFQILALVSPIGGLWIVFFHKRRLQAYTLTAYFPRKEPPGGRRGAFFAVYPKMTKKEVSLC
ncbi:MAG: hypothetical protein FWG66_11835, partial [Spirochaetes bacterium]|nr:hypothetical protein [Spirochaetota bacterium]